jgi:transcriptional regulator with XRE-family HTH domain
LEKSLFTPASDVIVARLIALRKKAGLTQRQLASRIRREPSLVAKVELGERRLDLHEFFQLCRALRADPEVEAAQIMRELKRLEKSGRKRKHQNGTPKK